MNNITEAVGTIRLKMNGGCNCKWCKQHNENIGEGCEIFKTLQDIDKKAYARGLHSGHKIERKYKRLEIKKAREEARHEGYIDGVAEEGIKRYEQAKEDYQPKQ